VLEVLLGIGCKPRCRCDVALRRRIECAVQKVLGLLHARRRRSEGIRIVEVSGRGPAPPVHSSPQCEVQQVLSP
jgi:hypothetical protein